MHIKEMYTDKARYNPGDPVLVTAAVCADTRASGTLVTQAWHLENKMDAPITMPIEA